MDSGEAGPGGSDPGPADPAQSDSDEEIQMQAALLADAGGEEAGPGGSVPGPAEEESHAVQSALLADACGRRSKAGGKRPRQPVTLTPSAAWLADGQGAFSASSTGPHEAQGPQPEEDRAPKRARHGDRPVDSSSESDEVIMVAGPLAKGSGLRGFALLCP